MAEAIYCFECGERIPDSEDMYNIGGESYICEDCRYRHYDRCEDCGAIVPDADIVAVNDDDRFVCRQCADYYYTCSHCRGLFGPGYIAVDTNYITLCDDCYDDHYFICEDCGEVYHRGDGEYIDGELYCESCAEDRRHSILSYGYKPDPIFYGGGNAGYGVELEIDDGEHKELAAKNISHAGEGHIYLKEDGSLSYDGMEIVTHPATLEYHMNHFPWAEICEAASSYGYKSHDTETCGLHIHASRSLFGSSQTEQDLTIAKIMLLFDRWYESNIVKFARRNLMKMKRWADKPDADILPSDTESSAIDKSKKAASHDRYKAINLCNSNTVEFRIFRGTLKVNTILASIQWVDTLIKYCRNVALKDLFNVSWNDIFGNTEHEELASYLKQRNLIKEDE